MIFKAIFKPLLFQWKKVVKGKWIILFPSLFLFLFSCQRPFLERSNQIATNRPAAFYNPYFSDADLKLPLTLVNEKNLRGTAVGSFIPLEKQFALVTANGYFYTMEKEDFQNAARLRPSKGASTAPAYANGQMYIASEWLKTGLNIYDFSRQKIVWALENAFSVSTPIVWQNKIFHAQKDGIIRCLNAKTYREIWRLDMQDQIRNNLAFDGELLFTATLSGKIRALVPESGSVAWQTKLHETVRAAPVATSSFCIIATVSGNLFLLDKQTGKIRFTKNLQQPFFVTPSVHTDRLYLGGSGGGFFVYDLSGDSLLWKTQLDGALMVPALILKNKIVVGTSRRQLYILDKTDGSLLQQMELEGRLSALPLPYDRGLIVGYEYKKLAFLKFTGVK